MAVDHYENFPVASLLVPAELRPAVEVIYAFARSADDIADEGDAAPEERQARLDAYLEALDRIEQNVAPQGELFVHLEAIIRLHGLPLQPFRDLISAFRQDTFTTRYRTYDALLDYCRRSANPVGKLMLYLYGAATEENLRLSDAVCTALQLINFWQDVGMDREKGRIYLPQEDMARFGVTEDMIADGVVNASWQALLQFETRRTRELMIAGAALSCRLPGRIGWELRLVVLGGLRILERIESVRFDVFNKRPVLKTMDWLHIFRRSLLYRF